jgi:hypothetical protein
MKLINQNRELNISIKSLLGYNNRIRYNPAFGPSPSGIPKNHSYIQSSDLQQKGTLAPSTRIPDPLIAGKIPEPRACLS